MKSVLAAVNAIATTIIALINATVVVATATVKTIVSAMATPVVVAVAAQSNINQESHLFINNKWLSFFSLSFSLCFD